MFSNAYIENLNQKTASKEVKFNLATDTWALDHGYILDSALQRVMHQNKTIYDPQIFSSLKTKSLFMVNDFFKTQLKEEEITLGSSVDMAIMSLLEGILHPGDEVLIFSPYHSKYPSLIQAAQGIVKVFKTLEDDDFVPDIDLLKKSLSPRVKVILLTQPSNPTGVVYPEEFLIALTKLAKAKNITLISDERESFFTPEIAFHPIYMIAKSFGVNAFSLLSLERPFLIDSWKVALVLSSKENISTLENVFMYLGITPSFLDMLLFDNLLEENPTFNIETANEMRTYQNHFIEKLNDIHGLRCFHADGSSHLFVNIQYYLGNEIAGLVPNVSEEFCNIIADKVGILLRSGKAYGQEGFVALNIARYVNVHDEILNTLKALLEG